MQTLEHQLLRVAGTQRFYSWDLCSGKLLQFPRVDEPVDPFPQQPFRNIVRVLHWLFGRGIHCVGEAVHKTVVRY